MAGGTVWNHAEPPFSKLEPLNFSRCSLIPPQHTHAPLLQRENNSFLESIPCPWPALWEHGRGSLLRTPPLSSVILTQSCFRPLPGSPVGAGRGGWGLASVPCHSQGLRGPPVLLEFHRLPTFSFGFHPSLGPRCPFGGVVPGKPTCFSPGSSHRLLVYNLHCPLT